VAELEIAVGEGPGEEAFANGGPVLACDIGAGRPRWPGFAEVALAEDVVAMFAFPPQIAGMRLGTLEPVRRGPRPNLTR